MSEVSVAPEQLEAVIRRLPEAFTTLDFAAAFAEQYPDLWQRLIARYGLYGSGTRYSVLTYLGNRLSSYSRRRSQALLEPMPVGWKSKQERYLRRSTPEERERFGSYWIAVFRRRG
ncbi:MAG: hypothetical protein QME94_15040 [Anaerolineae bacterium]|nr:hypothetical protein [Anaerolineae bacterium]